MKRQRWWNLVVGVVCAGLVVPRLLQPTGPMRLSVGIAGLALIAVAWVLPGTRAFADPRGWPPAASASPGRPFRRPKSVWRRSIS